MFKYFINLVELQTKVISVFSFIIAVLFYIDYLYVDNGIDVINFILFFVAMLCVDMFTTAINHISAYYKEKIKTEYDKNLFKHMNNLDYSMKTNVAIVISLVIVFTIIGLVIVYRSNVGVLLLGMLSVLVGILYSFGKKPISHTPFGEVFAGGFMGGVLPVIALFTQYDHLPLELNVVMSIVFVPLALLIGSILYANNLCDLEADVCNGRYTLAYYTKKPLGKWLLILVNVAVMIVILMASILGYLPFYFNFITLLIFILNKNVVDFAKLYDKQKSFPLIVKNFMLFSIVYAILFVSNIIFF